MTRNNCWMCALLKYIQYFSTYSIAFCSILPQDFLDFFLLQLCLFSQSGPECYLKTDFDTATSFKEEIISIHKYWCTANSILTNMICFIFSGLETSNKIVVNLTYKGMHAQTCSGTDRDFPPMETVMQLLCWSIFVGSLVTRGSTVTQIWSKMVE